MEWGWVGREENIFPRQRQEEREQRLNLVLHLPRAGLTQSLLPSGACTESRRKPSGFSLYVGALTLALSACLPLPKAHPRLALLQRVRN